MTLNGVMTVILHFAIAKLLVLPDSENCMIVSSFIWTKHQNVTDRQTDRQKCRSYYSACIASNVNVNVNELFLSPRESCNIVTTAAP